jgi:hypothetical protein
MAGVLHRLADRVRLRPDRGAAAEPVRPATPSVERRDQIAALIRRDYPFMSEDCIRQVLNDM